MAAIPLQVTEWMKGYLGAGAPDFDAGFIQGIESNAFFVHQMMIKIDDIDRFVADPQHQALMDGTVNFGPLGGVLPVTGASFRMFVDSGTPGLRYMKYRMPFTDDKGRPFTLYGHKTLHDDHSLDLWGDTTTLYTSIYPGDLPGAEPPPPPTPAAYRGIIHIEKLDLVKSFMSFRSPGSSLADANRAMSAFGKFFLGNLWEIYCKVARVGT